MRNLLLISTAFMALSPAVAAEEPVTVSAGEHDGYSRIVVAGGDADLAIETAGRMVRIRNIGDKSTIDLGDINARQKAFRVDRATQTGGDAIELQLNCDCVVKTSRTVSGKVVIDIADNTIGEIQSRPAPQQIAAQPPSQANSGSLDDTLTVEQARDRMMELLQQAASDGLISLKDSSSGVETADDDDARADAATQSPTDLTNIIARNPSPPPETKPAPQPEPQPAITPTPVNTPARQCLSDNVFAIDGSDFEQDPLAAIESLQVQVIEAQGTEKDAILRKLANGFLSVGFGEEALAALKNKERSAPVLFEIAHIVAERPLASDGVVLGAQNCIGAHALWQAASISGRAAATHYERSGRAIEMLPKRLKTLMATRLAVKMADHEAWEAAQDLFTVALGDSETLSPELKYVETRLADHDAKNESSRHSLLEIATQESSAADEALFALADSYAKQGDEPHEGFLEDIGALAKIGGSSRAAFFEAYSWASIGNLEAAMLLLKNETIKPDGDREMAGVSAGAMITRALSGKDALTRRAALEAYLAHMEWIDPEGSQAELRALVANFADEVGLPNLAYDLLAGLPGAPDKERNAKLSAAALAAGASKSAIKFAAPYASEPAFGEVLVQANIAQQDYDAALASATAISDDSTRARLKAQSGWLSRNWEAAYDGFRNTDPNTLDKTAAIRFALSAYKNGAPSMPNAVDAVLSSQADTVKAGLNSLFQTAAKGAPLQRARALSNATAKEIAAFEELLSDG